MEDRTIIEKLKEELMDFCQNDPECGIMRLEICNYGEKIAPFAIYTRICGCHIQFYYEFDYEDDRRHLFQYAKEKMHEIYMEANPKREELVGIYEQMLKIGMDIGILSVPIIAERIGQETVKDKYGYNHHYAPHKLSLGCENNSNVNELSKLFASSMVDFQSFPFLQCTAFFGRKNERNEWVQEPINDSELPKAISLIQQVLERYNAIVEKEFLVKKNDSKYQYRNVWDPECF